MTIPHTVFENGLRIATTMRYPPFDPTLCSSGLYIGSNVVSSPSGSTSVQVGQISHAAGSAPWPDGTYLLDFTAFVFDPAANLAGPWLRQRTLLTRRAGSFTAQTQSSEALPSNTNAVLNSSFPDSSTINLLIASHLDGAKVCGRWLLEYVGSVS